MTVTQTIKISDTCSVHRRVLGVQGDSSDELLNFVEISWEVTNETDDAMNSNDTGEDDDDGVYDDDDGSSVNMLEDGPLTRELDAE